MHASAIAAGVVYWNGATLEALAAVRALRDRGHAGVRDDRRRART